MNSEKMKEKALTLWSRLAETGGWFKAGVYKEFGWKRDKHDCPACQVAVMETGPYSHLCSACPVKTWQEKYYETGDVGPCEWDSSSPYRLWDETGDQEKRKVYAAAMVALLEEEWEIKDV